MNDLQRLDMGEFNDSVKGFCTEQFSKCQCHLFWYAHEKQIGN